MRNRLYLCIATFLVLAFPTSAAAAPPEWIEVKSPNFTVLTDAGEKRGREVTLRFEQMRAVFATLINKDAVNIPAPLQIIAFRRTKDYRSFTPKFEGKRVETAGFFQGGEDQNYILIDLSLPGNWETIFHEYAHSLIHGSLPRVPLWFDEGMAEYYSSITFVGDKVHIGLPPSNAGDVLTSQKLLPLTRLLMVKHDDKIYYVGDQRHLLYSQSWLTVHFLWATQRSKAMMAYIDLVNDGFSVSQAVQRAFGMEVAQLEKEIEKYLRGNKVKYAVRAKPEGIDKFENKVTAVPAIDARAMMADVHLRSPDTRELGLEEFEGILKEQPEHAAALRGRGYGWMLKGDMNKAGEYFRRAAQLNPRDARVFYYSAVLLNRDGTRNYELAEEAVKYLKRAIELEPSFADAHYRLGVALLQLGEPDEAIKSVRHAASLDRHSDGIRMTLAHLYMRRNQTKEARELCVEIMASSDLAVREAAQTLIQQIDLANSVVDKGAAEVEEVNLEYTESEVEEEVPVRTPVVEGKILFLKGTLNAVDCSAAPVAVLSIVAGTEKWSMRVRDTGKAIVIGADDFSCGWKAQRVKVNYRETGKNTGDVVSLELY